MDAVAALVASQLESDAGESLRLLRGVQLDELTEMWPFYVSAVQRNHVLVGDLSGAASQLELFQSLPLPRVPGVGFTGSVFDLCFALLALARQDPGGAMRFRPGSRRKPRGGKACASFRGAFVGCARRRDFASGFGAGASEGLSPTQGSGGSQ